MKKWISFTLCILLSGCMLAGCKKEPEPKPDTRPVLRVGMECAYVPYNWESYNDTFGGVPIQGSARFANGYDTKIAAKIADALDYRLVVVKLPWDQLLPSLQQGEIDLAVSAISPYGDADLAFSAPYAQSNIVVVVKEEGEYCHAESINDFQNATIAARTDTVHETLAGQMPNIQDEVLMTNYDSMIAALQNGEIDGYIADLPVARANCEKYEGFMYVNLVNNETGFETEDAQTQLSVAMPANSPLAATVDQVLQAFPESEQEKLMEQCIKKQP